MRVIERDCNPIPDNWTPCGEGDLATAGAIVPLDALLQMRPGNSGAEFGVVLPPGEPVELIAPFLPALALVCVEFPKFRDGRGFTTARRLRHTLGFTGDIRAVGHVLPDQFHSLISCGFSTILTPLAHPPERWRQSNPKIHEQNVVAGPLLVRMFHRGLAPRPEEKQVPLDD